MLHEVITSEKVPFSYRVAGLGTRLLAWLLDLGIIAFLCFVVLVIGLAWETVRSGIGLGVLFLGLFVVQWCYFLIFEWLWQGQTPGKWIVGIRVIQWQGTSITLSQAAVRNIVRVVDGLPLMSITPLLYGVGFLVAACNRAQRRLGDLAAGTIVVFLDQKPRPVRAVLEQSDAAQRHRTQVRQRLDQLDRAQKQTILDLCLRGDQLRVRDRARLFTRLAQYFRAEHELAPDEYESDEKFVRQLASVMTSEPAYILASRRPGTPQTTVTRA
jgi:uncharacterized RDD family membrane protein YckC